MLNLLRRTTPILCVLAIGAGLSSAHRPAAAQMADHATSEPFRVAAEFGFQPFAFKGADGVVQGFSVDLATELARRLGRPGVEVVDVVFSNIFAALFAKRFEMIIAPTTITESRAAQLLFTEPYLDVGVAFITRKDNRFKATGDLKGKAIGVTSGSVQDEWAKNNAEALGFTAQRFDKTADALQAVQIRRIDAYMSTINSALWVAKSQPNFAADLSIANDGRFGLPFRKDDVAFRNLVEGHLECMKLDGKLAEIHKKWFDEVPGPFNSASTVYVGFGAPTWPGYDPTPRTGIACPPK